MVTGTFSTYHLSLHWYFQILRNIYLIRTAAAIVFSNGALSNGKGQNRETDILFSDLSYESVARRTVGLSMITGHKQSINLKSRLSA